MEENDRAAVAKVHEAAFPRQSRSGEWIACNFAAFPRMQYFVAEINGKIVGFILWIHKAGFRPQAVLELEQIGVGPDHQGRGIGERLIRESWSVVCEHVRESGATVKSVLVTTRTDNAAQRLYAKTLGVRVVATVPDLYSADEVLMVKRLEP